MIFNPPSPHRRPKITVVGSLNVDHTLRVPWIPAPGETVTATGASTCFGGKGANQAVAAARAGGDVTLIGCVGDDDHGTRYIAHLHGEGIHIGAITKTALPTGSAFITVDDAGENCIVVNPGANHALQPHQIDSCADIIRTASLLLLQLECPLPTVLRAAAVAAGAGVPVILNPSPLAPEFISAGLSADVLIVNRHEAATLTAMTPAELQTDPVRALTATRCRLMVITRGGDPTLAISPDRALSIAPPRITPVDTVGAGDTFAGAFAVAYAGGWPLEDAIRFANAGGALATQKPGAQPAIPRRDAIASFMSA